LARTKVSWNVRVTRVNAVRSPASAAAWNSRSSSSRATWRSIPSARRSKLPSGS